MNKERIKSMWDLYCDFHNDIAMALTSCNTYLVEVDKLEAEKKYVETYIIERRASSDLRTAAQYLHAQAKRARALANEFERMS